MAKIYFDTGGYTVEVSSHGWFKIYDDDKLKYCGDVEELGLDYSRRLDTIGLLKVFQEVPLQNTEKTVEEFVKLWGKDSN